jgi:spermidine synthase
MSAFAPRPAVRLHPSAFIPPPSALFLAAVGCLGIAGQIVLLRELMAAYGGNEFSAGVTVATWLLCEALGAWLASAAPVRQRADRLRFSPPSSFLPALSVLFSLAAVPAAILVRPLLGVLPGETLSIPLLLLATFAVVFLPAATHGALFVTAAGIHAKGAPGRASNVVLPANGVGSAYVWEGVGTALAGLACFLLLNRLPSLAVVALSALPLIVATGVGHGLTRTKWTNWSLGFGALASVVLLTFGLSAEKLAWAAAWRGQRVVAISNSPYGKIVRLERAGQQLILYDGLPVLTVPPTQTERIEELSLLPVLCHPAPRRVLVLGSDIAIPAALARFRPDIDVAAVQLDPLLARTCLAALSSHSSLLPPLFSLTIADPVSFLRATSDTFDCIILTDAAPTSLGSSRLFAAELYQLCRSRLAPGGIVATAGPGDPTGLSPDLAGLLSTRLRTLKTAFEHVLPVATDFPLLLASRDSLNLSAETIASRLAALSEQPRLLDSSYVSGLLDPFRQEAFASQIANRQWPQRPLSNSAPFATRLSSAAFPRELFLNMVRENRLVSPGFGSLYARLGNLSPRLLLLLGAVLLIAGLVGARSGGRRFSRGFAILTSGFSGAAVSSLLLFSWQVRFGSVFSDVALLVAAFMLGTVLGGTLGSRSPLAPRPSSLTPNSAFFAADLVLATCAAAVMALIRGGPAGALLGADCLAGACLGFQFAVAGSIVHCPSSIVSAPATAARRAGVLTALDLVGGSLGGILTALVLVPVFGIGAAALVAGAVKLTSALAQLMSGRLVSHP